MKITDKLKKKFLGMYAVFKLHGFFTGLKVYAFKTSFVRKVGRLFFDRILIPVKILDNRMYLDIDDPGISSKLLMEGIREVGHLKQIQSGLKPGMTGIDLGSNIGYYALIEARLIGKGGKIYSIEPESLNIDLLRRNIKLNGFDTIIKVSQYLIGDHNGKEKFYISPCSNRHSMSPVDRPTFVETPMVTLDTFMDQNDLKPEDVDFLRMDIEGYEVMAFQGMQKLLNASSPLKIFMEFHPSYYPEWGWTLEKFLDYLESFGLRIEALSYERGVEEVYMNTPTREQILSTQLLPHSRGFQAYVKRDAR